jgi:hypothetical protein
MLEWVEGHDISKFSRKVFFCRYPDKASMKRIA